MKKLIIWDFGGIIAACSTMKEVKQTISNLANGTNLFSIKASYSR